MFVVSPFHAPNDKTCWRLRSGVPSTRHVSPVNPECSPHQRAGPRHCNYSVELSSIKLSRVCWRGFIQALQQSLAVTPIGKATCDRKARSILLLVLLPKGALRIQKIRIIRAWGGPPFQHFAANIHNGSSLYFDVTSRTETHQLFPYLIADLRSVRFCISAI
jgi:hypothetical protein